MTKRLVILVLLCFLPLCLNACIQIGGYRVPLFETESVPRYKAPGKTRFSESDLNGYRKSGSYYKTLNEQRNSHLPKGKAYTVRGKRYVPYASAEGFEEIGIASWYGPGFHGKKTSNGETFNTYSMTAAHKLLPFNSNILVTNLENGKTCVVRINDRGPFVDDRIIDLSQAAAEKIGMIKNGTAKVHLQYIGGEGSVTYSGDGSSGGIFGTLFGGENPAEQKAVYSEGDQSVSAALASLSGGSMASGGAGYSSSQSMAEVRPVYVNTAKAPGYASGQSSSSPNLAAGQAGANTVIGNLYLHLAVYEDKTVANRLVQELRKRNVSARIFNDNGFYAVQAGPFRNKDSAVKVQQYLKNNFPKAYIVVR